MDKIKTIKIKNQDGSISEESYTISIDARNVDMDNGKDLQHTIGNIDIDKNGSIAEQLNKYKNYDSDIENLYTDVDLLKNTDANLERDVINLQAENTRKKAYFFDTVADMKNANLKAGDYACTIGYYEANDGGAGDYQIVSGNYTDDGGSYHKLNNNLYAKLIVNNITVNHFGAKHNGQDDDSIYIQKMLDTLGYCALDNYTYLLKKPILLKTNKTLFGLSSKASIKIDSSIGNISAIELTKNNNVYGFTVIQSFKNWEGSIFECSSATLLKDTGFIKYENLRVQIHDLTLLTSSGTFYSLWAAHVGEDGTQYTVWGLWNSKVYNIECKGIINYIQKTYTYNPSSLVSEKAWLTDNMFRDCTFDSAWYGWFGSKTEETFNDAQYSTPIIKLYNCTVQAGSWSKYYIYMTGDARVTVQDCIPYDWAIENPGYSVIRVKNTQLTGQLNISGNSFSETYLNWISLTEDISSEYKETYLCNFLYINSVSYRYYQHPLPLQMENTTPTNYYVYQIATRKTGKFWTAFDLYYSFSCPVSKLQLYMDTTWGDKVYYTGLNTSGLLANTDIKFLKKDDKFYMAFKKGSFYAYVVTALCPDWLMRYFNELHLTNIGNNVDISSYTEIPMVNLNPIQN